MNGEDYEARKDEHRRDWPGYKSDHLPECIHPQRDYPCAWCQEIDCECPCICDRLRACEQRVLDEIDPMNRELFAEDRGFTKGVQAARDAVEAVGQQHPKWDLMSTHYEDCWKHHSECALTLALAAIDALRGEA